MWKLWLVVESCHQNSTRVVASECWFEKEEKSPLYSLSDIGVLANAQVCLHSSVGDRGTCTPAQASDEEPNCVQNMCILYRIVGVVLRTVYCCFLVVCILTAVMVEQNALITHMTLDAFLFIAYEVCSSTLIYWCPHHQVFSFFQCIFSHNVWTSLILTF